MKAKSLANDLFTNSAKKLPKALMRHNKLAFNPLEARIRQKISVEKRITFAKFMEMALYAKRFNGFEGGYYTAGKAFVGKHCHFNTFPQLNAPWFGKGIAKQLFAMWEALGKPKEFTAVEMGAGNGLMAHNILGHVKQNHPEFFKRLKYIIIEISKPFIENQKRLIKFIPQAHVEWIKSSAINYEFPTPVTGCFLSNELIDSFPVHKLVQEHNKFYEIYVTIKGSKLVEEKGKISTPQLYDYLSKRSDIIEGKPFYVNLAALDWLKNINKSLKRGFVLTIDYGPHDLNAYHKNEQVLRTYGKPAPPKYQHNPYYKIGKTDITTDVDFGALVSLGNTLGLKKVGLCIQEYYFSQILQNPLPKPGLSEENRGMKVLIQSKNAKLDYYLD